MSITRDRAYAILKLSPGATLIEIKKSYRRSILECHPDKVKEQDPSRETKRAEFNAKTQELNKAYEILSNTPEDLQGFFSRFTDDLIATQIKETEALRQLFPSVDKLSKSYFYEIHSSDYNEKEKERYESYGIGIDRGRYGHKFDLIIIDRVKFNQFVRRANGDMTSPPSSEINLKKLDTITTLRILRKLLPWAQTGLDGYSMYRRHNSSYTLKDEEEAEEQYKRFGLSVIKCEIPKNPKDLYKLKIYITDEVKFYELIKAKIIPSKIDDCLRAVSETDSAPVEREHELDKETKEEKKERKRESTDETKDFESESRKKDFEAGDELNDHSGKKIIEPVFLSTGSSSSSEASSVHFSTPASTHGKRKLVNGSSSGSNRGSKDSRKDSFFSSSPETPEIERSSSGSGSPTLTSTSSP